MSSTLPPTTGTISPTQNDSVGQRVQAALAASPLMALRRLTVSQASERIVISGSVSSFYQKQQAQELVRAEAPGLVVVNDVVVG